ncbi:MAG: glycyl-radical enzyme activating protein [Clostridia bacterium]|nr:glycyl-radical enzyme activating protein [Clostridia bacterium]
MKGIVFNIQRFCTDDGPGIRTTVFLKGCPLRCAWCHNPESHRKSPEILLNPDKCVLCGECSSVCENHVISDTSHVFNRSNCTSCGKCASSCFPQALELCGKEMSVEEVIHTVLRDKPFYQSTGGMTISGGEPLMQFAFTLALLKSAKENGIHTAIETSGYTEKSKIYEISEYTDLFLYDIKTTDDESHIKYTGVSNKPILENLSCLDSLSKKVILRCPMIPGVNVTDDHIINVFTLARRHSSVQSIEFEPYHPLGVSKSRLLGKEPAYKRADFLDKETIALLTEKHRHLIDKPFSIH